MNNFHPLVSIIIPVYNGSNYLQYAIDSALGQDYDNIEVVVVNDGSTDNTEEIAKSYGNKIKYFSKKNGGVSTALNLAIENSKGEYISWLSHDDYYLHNKISKQIQVLGKLEDRNKIIPYCNVRVIDLLNDIENDYIKKQKRVIISKYDSIKSLFLFHIHGCALLIPRNAFYNVGFFDVKLLTTQDYYLWVQFIENGYIFMYIPEILVVTRWHIQQNSRDTKATEINEDVNLWEFAKKTFYQEIKKAPLRERKIFKKGKKIKYLDCIYRLLKKVLKIFIPHGLVLLHRYYRNKKTKETFFLGQTLIVNLNADLTKKQPRVLISYISKPLLDIAAHHTNISETFQIIQYFSSRNFIIDLVYCNDITALSKIQTLKYDFIFGFGDVFYFMTKNYPNINNCIYVTENTPDFSHKKEKERIDYYYYRHKIKIPFSRTGNFYKNEHFDFAKNALTMGIESQLYRYSYTNLQIISPTGLLNTNFTKHCEITDKIKKSFLWFGSRGAVHKGLDILIDIVENNKDLTLHICGLDNNEKYLFKEKILKCKNIYDHGFINTNSQKFVEIINSVTFLVFPSCSEGMSSAVLTIARHGVLLLLQNSSGMDRIGEHAFWLEDFKIEHVEKRMREVSALGNDYLTQKSRELQKYANREFCLDNFTENFKKCMDKILI